MCATTALFVDATQSWGILASLRKFQLILKNSSEVILKKFFEINDCFDRQK